MVPPSATSHLWGFPAPPAPAPVPVLVPPHSPSHPQASLLGGGREHDWGPPHPPAPSPFTPCLWVLPQPPITSLQGQDQLEHPSPCLQGWAVSPSPFPQPHSQAALMLQQPAPQPPPLPLHCCLSPLRLSPFQPPTPPSCLPHPAPARGSTRNKISASSVFTLAR